MGPVKHETDGVPQLFGSSYGWRKIISIFQRLSQGFILFFSQIHNFCARDIKKRKNSWKNIQIGENA